MKEVIKCIIISIVTASFFLQVRSMNIEIPYLDEEVRKVLDFWDNRYYENSTAYMNAWWNFTTNLENIEARNKLISSMKTYQLLEAEAGSNISTFKFISGLLEVDLYRQARFMWDKGPGGLKKQVFNEYNTLQENMLTVFEEVKICEFGTSDTQHCNMTLPEISKVMASSNNTDELYYYWEEWHRATGPKMQNNYKKFITILNQSAKNDDYKDAGEFLLNEYTVTEKEVKYYKNQFKEITQSNFKLTVDKLWKQIKEKLYLPLHSYVRLKLSNTSYPSSVDTSMPIPAHVLGDLWAMDWSRIYEKVKPFPEIEDFDVTKNMTDKNWDIKEMYDKAQKFFTDLKFPILRDEVWNNSILNVTSEEKKILCVPSVIDIPTGRNKSDPRLRMCAKVNMEDFITIHSKLGLIHYYENYKDHPLVFRRGANPGFHEAIENLIKFSVSTPSHLKKILNPIETTTKISAPGSQFFKKEFSDDEKARINRLMKIALQKIPELSFGYVADKFRWSLFDGAESAENMNVAWWLMREDHQGIIFPGKLRGNDHFDPGAFPLIPANLPTINKFVGILMGFQIHANFCARSFNKVALDECDIDGDSIAGALLQNAMKNGFSKPWPKILEDLSGSNEISTSPMFNYFQPLIDYFDWYNQTYGLNLDWKSKIENRTDELISKYEQMNENMTDYLVKSVTASWNYNTNITKETAEAANNASLEFSANYYVWWNEVIKGSAYEYIKNESLKRQFEKQRSVGASILNDTLHSKLNQHLTSMMEKYSSKVCPFSNRKCTNSGDKYDIDKLEIEMGTNTAYSELLYYWEKWRELSGSEMLSDFKEYVQIMNETAHLNGFIDAGSMWIEPYTSRGSDRYTEKDFKNEIAALWEEIKPKYAMLHAYVRHRLKQNEEYKSFIHDDNLIPAHILGNMWAQSWENIYELVVPYKDEELIDITESLKNKTEKWMFESAEKFFTSISLYPMTKDFWNQSMIVQPEDREVVCHASAWDFYSTELNNTADGKFRIKMCTNKNQEDFITIHHEMGHTEYQMAYSHLPLIFRDGANPGFHEAIGDTIALSASTPAYLEQLFSLSGKKEVNETKRHINFLMKQALSKVAFLPYAYILDQWRWEIFSGEFSSENYNELWWKKRLEYQGVKPPIKRSASKQLDAASKFHIPANVPYIRYFVSHILQFQFHERLCDLAKIEPPYSKCSIYKHEKSGTAFREMLKKGASEPWQDILKDFLKDGNGSMNALSINKYFQPLWKFLEEEIADKKIKTGWHYELEDHVFYGDNNPSGVVPIVVGCVLLALVSAVLVAFFIGRNKRRKKEKKAFEAKQRVVGELNKGLEEDDQF